MQNWKLNKCNFIVYRYRFPGERTHVCVCSLRVRKRANRSCADCNEVHWQSWVLNERVCCGFCCCCCLLVNIQFLYELYTSIHIQWNGVQFADKEWSRYHRLNFPFAPFSVPRLPSLTCKMENFQKGFGFLFCIYIHFLCLLPDSFEFHFFGFVREPDEEEDEVKKEVAVHFHMHWDTHTHSLTLSPSL